MPLNNKPNVHIVIYEALRFDVAQGRLNREPNVSNIM